MNTKQNQRVMLTKRLLRESLMELMEKKPISRITVSELCSAAEVNRTTFYNHYGSPYDVLEEIGENLAKKLCEFGKVHNENFGWTIDLQVAEICRYLRKHSKESRLLFENFSADSNVIKNILHQRIISEPAYAEFIRRYDQEMQLLLNTFITNGIYSLIRLWLLEDIDKTPEEIGALALEVSRSGWLR